MSGGSFGAMWSVQAFIPACFLRSTDSFFTIRDIASGVEKAANRTGGRFASGGSDKVNIQSIWGFLLLSGKNNLLLKGLETQIGISLSGRFQLVHGKVLGTLIRRETSLNSFFLALFIFKICFT